MESRNESLVTAALMHSLRATAARKSRRRNSLAAQNNGIYIINEFLAATFFPDLRQPTIDLPAICSEPSHEHKGSRMLNE